MRIRLFLLLVICLLSSCDTRTKQKNSWSLASPDGKLLITLLLDDSKNKGLLQYKVMTVKEDSIEVIQPSTLGITRSDESFIKDLQFVSETSVKEGRETYQLVSGKKLKPDDIFSEKEVTFQNSNGAGLTVVVRAFNNGVAFRYLFPEKDTAQQTITNEITEFNIGAGAKAWMQPYEKPNEWGPAYETAYVNGIASGTSSPNEAGWCFPSLFRKDSVWMLVTEANINGSFYGSHLHQHAPEGKYTLALPDKSEALNHYAVAPESSLPWATPWRLIIIGKSLGTIVESTLVTSLSEPNQIGNVSWVKPGRSSWSWWSDHSSPRDYNKLVPFIDMAASMGWEYSLVDANWNTMVNGDIEKLIDYAKSKNVGLFLWYNSGGNHTEITEQPRDIMSDPVKRKAEFKKLRAWGVKGVKVDFFNSDKPAIMNYYQDILKDAANEQIMVLFHGCTLPRGWERTYPNLMTMEGVRGAEQYWDSVFAENAQTHHTILPCTRNVVGPMDYTPVTFTHSDVPHLTTYAHELALAVLFESGVMHFSDRVSGYKNLPADVQEILKSVPVTWDETKFVHGYPGEKMVIARRKGSDWFVAGVNGEKTEKNIELDLSFIDGHDYRIISVYDGESAVTFNVQKKEIDLKHPLGIRLLPRGGFVIRLMKS